MITTITVLDTNGNPRQVHASVDGLFAVTPACGGRGIDPLGVWTVTHIPTGTAIMTTFSPVQARMCQRRLAGLTLDWSSPVIARYRRQWRKYKLPVQVIAYELSRSGRTVHV